MKTSNTDCADYIILDTIAQSVGMLGSIHIHIFKSLEIFYSLSGS